MSGPVKIQVVADTDVGKVRTINEDNFILCSDLNNKVWSKDSFNTEVSEMGTVLLVADGMGGAVAGEEASRIAIESISEFLSKKLIHDQTEVQIIEILNAALIHGHEQICNKVRQNAEFFGMGTTATICYIKNNKLFLSWVGDSRVYRYSSEGRITNHSYASGDLEILSSDHSHV